VKDDAVRFYTSYVKKKGLGVIRRTARHGEDNKLHYFILACPEFTTNRGNNSLS
jgi:hypothetical protein